MIRPKKKKEAGKINLYCYKEDKDYLAKRAKETGHSPSEYIRLLLEQDREAVKKAKERKQKAKKK